MEGPLPPSLTGAVTGFCRHARKQGLTAGIQETLDAVETARLGVFQNRNAFRRSLRALLCTNKEEYFQFNDLFAAYWDAKDSPKSPKRPQHTGHLTARSSVPLLMIGARGHDTSTEEGKTSTGASAAERLHKTDFSKVPLEDQDQLEKIALRLFRIMSIRLSRQRKPTSNKEQIDLRRTIRRSIGNGGTPISLAYRGRKPRTPHLTALLDVSASMDQYSFFLLRFLYALSRYFGRVDSFVFSTRLQNVSEALKAHRLPTALALIAECTESWSSGTRIGACLETFNEEYGRRAVSKNTIVLVLSDGLDTGDPDRLGREVRRLRQRSKKLIWLNPLLGMEGYEPATRGIQAILPHVDGFLAVHNLESLLRLETHLGHV